MPSAADPLVTLRRHAADAPWSGRELAVLVDRLLAAADRAPPRATTVRTLHYYVTNAVIQPPQGRGAGAGWGYAQLVELLVARLRQEAGASLEAIAAHRRRTPLDALEVEAAGTLAIALPAPRASDPRPEALPDDIAAWREFTPARGVMLRLAEGHSLLDHPGRLAALLDGLAREAGPLTREP
jgi:hypothetical protein